ncbi:separase isoform X1 [Tanacetum coccineum]
MYFFSHKEITPSQLTHYKWACFFHQLTVGSGVNYLFSQRLRQVCGAGDPDELLHRLTHKWDAELDRFVTKFFEDLKPHTILVINILGNKYKDLLKIKLEPSLHSNCVGLMMISRFNSKHKQLVGLFPISSTSVAKSGESSRGPWGTNTIVDTIAPELKGIINDFGSPFKEVLNTIDGRISTLMRRMESWFGLYKYVLLGETVGGPITHNLDYLSSFIGIGLQSTSSSYGGQSEGKSKRAPIILVLDKNIQMLPWERMEASKDQEFYRMPSVSSTFYTCYKNWEHIERGSAFSVRLDPLNAYYVINPHKSSDEKQCVNESRLADIFKQLNLQGSMWEEHVGDVIVEQLQTCDLFMYSGHGDGFKHIPEGGAALAKLERCAAAILMGCMSGLLKVKGPYTPTGAVLEYLLAGSPIVIGNLGKVYPSWALFLYNNLLQRCRYKLGMRGVGIASCLVGARNASKLLMFASNSVCYGVPTLIWYPYKVSKIRDHTL